MIAFTNGNFKGLNETLEKLKLSKIFVLCDENTHELCLPLILPQIETTAPVELIEIEAGEEMKTTDTAVQLWEILAEHKADRQALVLNLGGGVISDLGGFVASTFKRGIKFINVPTTLLAMVDASLGGKTGVDLAGLKNIVGTFSQAQKVILYPPFLKTLPYRELRSGFAEMLKHGIIADKSHFSALSELKLLSPEALFPHIQMSLRIKENIVKEDFEERNIRKTLNFGHTIGHAIESFFLLKGQPVLHGEAVAAGIFCETFIALEKGFLSSDDSEVIFQAIKKFFPKILLPDANSELLNLMQNDKKNQHNTINFALPRAIGSCAFDIDVNESLIIPSLKFYRNSDGFYADK